MTHTLGYRPLDARSSPHLPPPAAVGRGSFLQSLLRRKYRRYCERLEGQVAAEDQPRRSMVFAPHQDDETLGCGGTIISRIGTGAEVAIVFMTEGRTSHGHLMSAAELVKIRRQEALLASRVLGVKEKDVVFLNFEDGRLSDHYAAAVGQVISLLRQWEPDEVFIPYHREPNLDHMATNRIVLAAISAVGATPMICEYPVWVWHHWPWVRFRQHTPPGTRAVIHNTFANAFGIRLLKDFGYIRYIGDVIDRKAAALNEHRSQMTRLLPDPSWLTLNDVSDGDFLACFFQDYEVFYRYRFTDVEVASHERTFNEI